MPMFLFKTAIFFLSVPQVYMKMSLRQSSDINHFRQILEKAKNIVVMTGAGVSAESGIPTFRGAGGYWKKYEAASLATPEAFRKNPRLVWEFYNYRREVAAAAKPNAAHTAIAQYEARHKDKIVTVVTQNVDALHARAGSRRLIELHGNLFKTRCCKCEKVQENYDIPICEGLSDETVNAADEKTLPRCACSGLLRPHIVWFGESLDSVVLQQTEEVFGACEVCLVVGTSSVVYPAAMFAPAAAAHGATVAEFNLERTSSTDRFQFHFEGSCADTLLRALSLPDAPQRL